VTWREFALWREGVRHALDGGLWLHRFSLMGEPWAHLVSANREALLAAGRLLDMPPQWLQYRPLGDPRLDRRVDAWHWDLRRHRLERALELAAPKIPYVAGRRSGEEDVT
jgi:hypothetical protein